MNKKCFHMFSGLHITPEGYIHLCGISKEKSLGVSPFHIDDIENLQEFFNTEYFLRYRKQESQNINICIPCNLRENSDVKSTRNMISSTYKLIGIEPSIIEDECKLEHLDVSFNNLCNQQCLMCSSEYSSKWYMFDNKNKNTQFQRKPIKYKKWTNKTNMLKILDILPQLKLLVIKGGEPLIQEEVKQVLLFIINNDLNVNVEFLSNFQEISDEMLNILHSLKKLTLRISLDSSGKMYNWTRGGNWDKTINNLENFMKGCKNDVELGYTNTLNRWSYRNLIDDIKIVEKINSKFCKSLNNYNILPVIGPKYTSPFSAPLQERVDFIFEFEKEFGFIVQDFIEYKTLKINHLFNVLSLQNDPLQITDELIEMSDRWKEEIVNLRKNNTDVL